MKIAIMQPYFFPYIGYFSLIHYTDKFIIFDVVQYIRKGWINRNRILKPDEGWQYFNVPVQKHSRDTLIQDIKVNNEEKWQEKIIKQLEHYKKKAPYYDQVIDFLREYLKEDKDKLVDLNTHILARTCAYIGIEFKYEIFSSTDIQIETPKHPGQWALNISEALGAKEYVNPPGGKEIFNKEEFKAKGIKLKFLESALPYYNQKRQIFEPGLSIIDVMLFNSKEEIKNMLENFILHEQ